MPVFDEAALRQIIRDEVHALLWSLQAETPATLRGELGITELAHKAGVNRNALARLESGKLKRVQARIVTKVAKVLGVPTWKYAQAVQRVRKGGAA